MAKNLSRRKADCPVAEGPRPRERGTSEGHSDHSMDSENRFAVRIKWALALTGGFMLVETAGGLISGSLALLADAGHMLTDTASLGIALAAYRLSRRRPDESRSYGYHRAQVLAAFVNGLVLFAVSGWIFIEAVQRIMKPIEVLGGLMMGTAFAGLAVNLIVFAVLRRGSRENLNLQGALLHVLADLMGSIAAIAASSIILATGWYPADPLLSVFVGLLIARSAWKIVGKSAHVLMEGTPETFETRAIRDSLVDAVEDVTDVHHIHAWVLTPEQPPLLTLHVDVSEGSDPRRLLPLIKHHLKERFGIEHATVQLEWPAGGTETVSGGRAGESIARDKR